MLYLASSPAAHEAVLLGAAVDQRVAVAVIRGGPVATMPATPEAALGEAERSAAEGGVAVTETFVGPVGPFGPAGEVATLVPRADWPAGPKGTVAA